MSDIFQEIQEEIKTERLVRMWKKYKRPLTYALAALLIGSTAYNLWSRHQQSIELEAASSYLNALNLIDAQKQTLSLAQLEDLPLKGVKQYTTLSKLVVAALLSKKGDMEGAIEVYKDIETTSEKPYRQFAFLRRMYLQLDTANPPLSDKDISTLMSLQKSGSPWKPLAQEIQGLIHVKNGDYAKAIAILEEIQTSETKINVSARANMLLSALKGR